VLRSLTDREFFCFNDVRGLIGRQVLSQSLSYRRSDDGGMVEMIVSRSRFVAVFILLCLGTLALFSSATFAQVFPGDNPSGVGNSSSSPTEGQDGCNYKKLYLWSLFSKSRRGPLHKSF